MTYERTLRTLLVGLLVAAALIIATSPAVWGLLP